MADFFADFPRRTEITVVGGVVRGRERSTFGTRAVHATVENRRKSAKTNVKDRGDRAGRVPLPYMEKHCRARSSGRWACLDLNQGPHPYQGCALTRLSYRPEGQER